MEWKDLTGHVCVVTGANSGIGKATARGLAEHGARVVMVCRSEERGTAARRDLVDATGNDEIDLLLADLAVQDEVRALGTNLCDRYDRLDVLVHNAGVFNGEREETPDGIELTLAVNHLAPFLLTHVVVAHVIDTAKAHGEARIVTVGSEAHRGTRIDFDDLQGKNSYNGLHAYSQSKLANVLFTHELARRLQHTDVTANCVHPGVVATNIWRGSDWLSRIARLFQWFYRSPDEGSRGPLYLAAAKEVEGVSGCYFRDDERAKPAPVAYDEKIAARLWRVSRELTGMPEERPEDL